MNSHELNMIREALWHLGDRFWLDECPLAALPWIIEAARPYHGVKVCPEGFVVQQELTSALKVVATDLGPSSIVGALALARLSGTTNASVARRFGIREETISRTYMSRLVVAVARFFFKRRDLAA